MCVNSEAGWKTILADVFFLTFILEPFPLFWEFPLVCKCLVPIDDYTIIGSVNFKDLFHLIIPGKHFFMGGRTFESKEEINSALSEFLFTLRFFEQ